MLTKFQFHPERKSWIQGILYAHLPLECSFAFCHSIKQDSKKKEEGFVWKVDDDGGSGNEKKWFEERWFDVEKGGIENAGIENAGIENAGGLVMKRGEAKRNTGRVL